MRTLPLALYMLIIATHGAPAYAQAPALPKAPEAPREKPPKPLPEDDSFKPTRTKPIVDPLLTYGVLGTATLGFLAGGIVFNIYANDAAADTKSLHRLIEVHRPGYTDRQLIRNQPILNTLCARQEQKRAEWDTHRNRAAWSYFISGGLFALTAGIALYPWLNDLTKPQYRRMRKTEAIQFAPILGSKEQGFQIQYSF